MFDFYKYINFIDGAIGSISLTPDKRAELLSMRDAVVARYNDPTLYLSMLSDFSAGKSTLINRLIGRNLLRTANLATTSVPTYIRNHSDPETVIIARTLDGRSYDVGDPAQRAELEQLIGFTLPEDERRVISLLTTDELKEKHKIFTLDGLVRDVSISLPYSTDIGNLCIVDTPGVNPGTDTAASHAPRTVEILENVADSAIILFPSHQDYSHSFQTFLHDNALKFLSDAIFVVTMMDLIDEEERDEVTKDVEVNLKNNFKLERVKLLTCAAQKAGKDEYWTEVFEDFKKTVYAHLSEQREHFINRSLSILLQKLLAEIDKGVSDESRQLEEKLAILEQNSVPSLSGVLDSDIRSGREALKRQKMTEYQKVKSEADSLPSKIRSRVNSKLNGFGKRSQIEAYAKNQLADDVKDECGSISSALAESDSRLKAQYSAAAEKMADTLRTYYGNIEKLANDGADSGIRNDLAKISGNLDGDLSGISVNISGGVGLASAVVGAGVAAAVFAALGPVGWIAGALVGLFGSDYLYVGKARDQIRDGLNAKLPDIISSVKEKSCQVLDEQEKKYSDDLISCRDKLVLQYSLIYHTLKTNLENERQRIMTRIHSNNFIKYNINLYSAELSSHIGSAG